MNTSCFLYHPSLGVDTEFTACLAAPCTVASLEITSDKTTGKKLYRTVVLKSAGDLAAVLLVLINVELTKISYRSI